jgi:hypothetical protein
MNHDEIEYILLQYIDRNHSGLAAADSAEVEAIWQELLATDRLQEVVDIGYAGGSDLVEQRRTTRTSAGATRLTELKGKLGK